MENLLENKKFLLKIQGFEENYRKLKIFVENNNVLCGHGK